MMWTIFFISLFPMCMASLEVFVEVIGRFFNQVFFLLIFKCSLCILDNSPLSGVSSTNIFFQSAACLLILLTLSFFF